MKETIETVTKWANETFGPAPVFLQVQRAMQEIDELWEKSLGYASNAEIAEEAADVCICLYRVIGTLDPEAINKKMQVNRARKWDVRNGVGQHTKDYDERETNP